MSRFVDVTVLLLSMKIILDIRFPFIDGYFNGIISAVESLAKVADYIATVVIS